MPRNRLQPGQNTIDSAKIKPDPRGGYRMLWSICLPDGKVLSRDTRGRMTKGELRAKAHRQAEELLVTQGKRGSWTTSSLLGDYITAEAIPAVASTERLRENTKKRYILCLNIANEELGQYPIASALQPDTFRRALVSISQKHGTTSARQVRKIANKWIVQPLIMCRVLSANPIAGFSFDLPEHKASNKPDGGHGLTEVEWSKALDWLLAVDWKAILTDDKPIRGRYTRKQLANARRAVVELTALQATTGLRLGEALALTWNEVSEDCTTVEVTNEVSKTHRGRIAPVLDMRVSERLLTRRKDSKAEGFVFPSPAADNPNQAWDKSNCMKAIGNLYKEMSEACGIELLTTARSHVWRTTLHTVARDKGVPIELRAALFGHDPETAKRYYTDTADVTSVAKTFEAL